MFFVFLLIISFFSASHYAVTKFSRSKTINVGNNSALDLAANCTAGFTLLNGVCVDVDECQSKNICPDLTFCINTIGSYVCEKCPPGERIKPGSKVCTCDHEECSKIHGRYCEENMVGLEECVCMPEFVEDIKGKKCALRCPFGSSFNFTSSPKEDCACPDTHRKHGSFCLKKCRDRGDCNGGEGCELLEGHLVCACPRGFKLDHAKKQCIDINECRNFHNRGGICANFPGNYGYVDLSCDSGFTPQTELGLCLKEENGITHLMKKTVFGLIMRDFKENQALLTTKLPKAYELELSEVRINPEEFAEYIRVSIQSKDDESQELIMESIKPFPRERIVYINVIARIPEKGFIYELKTRLYVTRLPFTFDIIGHD